MTEKATSAEIAAIAGRILGGGDPFENDQVRNAMGLAIIQTGAIPHPSFPEAEKIIDAIRPVLKPYIDNMLSLAGSAVSQADRDEGEDR